VGDHDDHNKREHKVNRRQSQIEVGVPAHMELSN